MILKRFDIVLVLIATLFTFGDSLAVPTPRESVRIEVVLSNNKQQEQTFISADPLTTKPAFFVTDEFVISLSHHLVLHSLLIEAQHHHSTL